MVSYIPFLIFACGLYVSIYGAWWVFSTYPRSAGAVLVVGGMGIMLSALELVLT